MKNILNQLVLMMVLIYEIVSDQPNILFIMADDLGWNDVDWHDYNMHTPVLYNLAHHNGVRLNRAYVNKLCSITRSAFLAGRYPFLMGTQDDTFIRMEPAGVPLDVNFFPQDLQKLGYTTYLVGKWHLGYCKEEYLPNNRGFDYFRGFYGGMQDFYNHSFTKSRIYTGYDLWEQRTPRFDLNGSYSTQAVDYLQNHNKSKPFFMFLAYQAVHCPLQVPSHYLNSCKQKSKKRRIYCGMMNAMDQSIGTVVNNLKRLGYYNNTIIFFSTDNGGDTRFGGNNYPLRGNKNTLWEGGTRAISFVHSNTFIKKPGVRNQLFSVVDWYPTILSVAGVDIKQHGDGINQWKMISEDTEGKRTSFVYNIWPSASAIRSGQYKLIVGKPGYPDGWIPPSGFKKTKKYLKKSENVEEDKGLYLFDLENDPYERTNLVSYEYMHIVARMLKEIADYFIQMEPSVHKGLDVKGDPKYFNGTFGCCFC